MSSKIKQNAWGLVKFINFNTLSCRKWKMLLIMFFLLTIQLYNFCFENVETFKCLGVRVTNVNDVREKIKHTGDMRNIYYYLLEKILSSRLLCKKLKVNTYKTIILPVVLCNCETWPLTMREELRFRVFENQMRRKIFGAKRDEINRVEKSAEAEVHALYSTANTLYLGILNRDD